MKQHYTDEQIKEAKSIVAAASGRKGGASWWESLTQEQRQERITKMVEARKSKKDAQTLD